MNSREVNVLLKSPSKWKLLDSVTGIQPQGPSREQITKDCEWQAQGYGSHLATTGGPWRVLDRGDVLKDA